MRDLEKDPLRVGILGCGGFFLRRIVPALKEVKTVRIVSMQNRSLEKALALAEQYGIPRAVSSREELLSNPDVELVHIMSPNFLHEEDALACAAAGKAALCEKPLSTSLSSVARMIQAFAQKNLPFFVGHQLRFKPALQKARALLLSKELGELLQIRAYFYSCPLSPDNWRLIPHQGGGALQEIGIHLVDLIHFLTGQEMTQLQALSCKSHVDQQVSVQGKLSQGALASFACAYGSAFYNGFEVIGTKKRLVSSESLRQTLDPIESFCMIGDTGEKIFHPIQAIDVYAEEYKHLALAITQNIPSPIEASISLSNQRVIDAAYASLESEK